MRRSAPGESDLSLQVGLPWTTIQNRQEQTFVFTHVTDLKTRSGQYLAQLGGTFSTSNKTATAFYTDSEVVFNQIYPQGPTPPYKNISNVQGSNGAWKSDRYASELLGHTMLAAFLTTKRAGVYELDFTGTGAGAAVMVPTSLCCCVLR